MLQDVAASSPNQMVTFQCSLQRLKFLVNRAALQEEGGLGQVLPLSAWTGYMIHCMPPPHSQCNLKWQHCALSENHGSCGFAKLQSWLIGTEPPFCLLTLKERVKKKGNLPGWAWECKKKPTTRKSARAATEEFIFAICSGSAEEPGARAEAGDVSESQLGSTLDMKIMPLFIEGKGRRRLLGNKIVSCVRSDDMPPNLLSLENRNVEVKLFGRVSAIQSWLAKGRTGAYPVKKEK